MEFGRSRGLRAVRADTLKDNVKSQNVLRRCGFRFLREDGTLWWERDLTHDYRYITLREQPETERAAAEWFHDKWGVPAQAYLDCMDGYLAGETEYGWYLCLDGADIVGGLGVIENDFHDRKDLTPNVCAVYVEPTHRRRGIAQRLLDLAVEDQRAHGVAPLYLLTDHTGFYERYGWEFYCMARGDGEDRPSRMYIHR